MGNRCVSAAGWLSFMLAALSGVATGSPPVAPTEARSPQAERAGFHVPAGFEVQLVAAEPDIHKPMNLAFDARGRLWVTDTVEYPFPVDPGKAGRDSVKVLEDFDDNGRARKITTFVDGLNIPLGVLPYQSPRGQAALVYSIPEVRRYTDADGDGKADIVETVLSGFASVDTHGMTNNFVRGFDGWVYANHGFRNESVVRDAAGHEIKMSSGNTYRFRPDGRGLEFFAHGQVNPFGLCFDPWGDLFSADCHSRPQYMLLQGAHYPSFGKPDDGLGYGPEMCVHDHGSTAIAGTCYYAAEQFPAEFRGDLFNGNPVTNRINRDRLEWRGSSPWAVEMPDLLVSDDPWFRPVQVKLGPDGAVWVADFYNKIIGHYEVDLNHPGRDHTSGRIWRIVYKGDGPSAPAPGLPDLAKLAPGELVAKLGDANLAVRMLATNYLCDAADKAGAAPLKAALAHPINAQQAAHALWALHRLGALSEAELASAATHADPLVRTHAMRILKDLAPDRLNAATAALALKAGEDADPRVRRAAAGALARRAEKDAITRLATMVRQTPAEDTHLRHAARMALRDALSRPGALADLNERQWDAPLRATLADAAAGVASAEAGAFLVRCLKDADVDAATAARYLKHAARYVPAAAVGDLADMARSRFGGDVGLQLELYQSVAAGLAERGAAPGDALRTWGKTLVEQVFAHMGDPPTWTSRPLPQAPTADPWGIKDYPSVDGVTAPFFSSLPHGEALTGTLTSPPFTVPPRLTFWMAGHNGLPPEAHPVLNLIRLRDAASGQTLAEAPPPRHDIARKVDWDLTPFVGRKAYLEATDGDAGSAYAWLAFGRLDPPVAPLPTVDAAVLSRRQEQAADIAAALKLAEMAGPLRDALIAAATAPPARTAAAKALAAIDAKAGVLTLAQVLTDPAAPPAAREAAAAGLAPIDSDAARNALISALNAAPRDVQTSLASALAATRGGADALLTAIADGKASPRLLQNKPIRDRLVAAKPDQLDQRLATLTRGMISADAATQKVIDARRAAFDPAKASAERGAIVFTNNCAACHRIDNAGANIGPQLDGIGKRGADRVIEDILDPSRNVDGAFRYSNITLNDGDMVAGLERRQEGETVVFADAQGKEFTLPTAKISKRTLSQLSLMPANFADTIPPEQFGDLLAYLLAK